MALSIHVTDDGSGENVELLQQAKALGELVMVRCPTCQGLRGIATRHLNRYSGQCADCKRGHVVPRWRFYTFWIERFSREEIRDMGRAIWP